MGGKRWSNEENAILEAIAKEGAPLISQMHRLPGAHGNPLRVTRP